MEFLHILIVGIFGLFIGSFLNVVIYRYQSGWGLHGRSMCMTCSKTLSWYELIPVLSYLWQGGKCRSCKTNISAQYPLVEIVTATLFVLLANKFIVSDSVRAVEVAPLIYAMFVASILVVIAVYDFRHKIIPNALVYVFILVSFLSVFANAYGLIVPDMFDAAAGIILPLPFFILLVLSKGRLIGMGDIKLMMGMGFFLGLSAGVAALIIAFWLGAIVSVFLLFMYRKRYGMKSEIPFGPFLIASTLLVYIAHITFATLEQCIGKLLL